MWHRFSYIVTKVVQPPLRPAPQAHPPPAVVDMEPVASSIQVLLQAAEFLERRERGEARPLPGVPAASSLTRARAGRGSQLEGCVRGLGALAPGSPCLPLERGPRAGGLGGVGERALAPKPLPACAEPGAPAAPGPT